LAASQPAGAGGRLPNVPQSAVVHGGPQSSVQAAPEPQFHLPTPNRVRPVNGDSLLARPPSVDSSGSAAAASGSAATE
jgi:outer membrane protein assembly factor BamE